MIDFLSRSMTDRPARKGPRWLAASVVGILITYWILAEPLRVEAACIPQDGCTYALAYYTVQQGDTIGIITQNFQINPNDLQSFNNNLTNVNVIMIGQRILIPFNCGCLNGQLLHRFSYTIKSGDTVAQIVAGPYESLTTVTSVAAASNLNNVNSIITGNALIIPVDCSCGDPSVSPAYGLFTTYYVESNDSLTSVASKFSIDSALISKYNPVFQTNQFIFLPTRDGKGTFPPFNGTITSSSSSSKSTPVGAIVGAVVGAVVLVAAIGIGIFCFYIYIPRRKNGREEMKRQQSALIPSSIARSMEGEAVTAVSSMLAELKSVEFTYEELREATSDFSMLYKIGQGGYASVYYGVIRNQKLAIKRMTLQATKEFLAELQILTHVHHNNLVQLIGYCTVNGLFLIYEYIENGTLDQHLHMVGGEGMLPLTWPQRVQIALDAARGLEYIHEHTKPTYIHRDIKCANILIDNNFRAKVADFGLTKLTEAGSGTGIVGTFGYMSPEYALYGEVSPKLDVYAFGVVLFEIITARVPISSGSMTETSSVSSSSSPRGRVGRTLVTLFEPILRDPDGKATFSKYVDRRLHEDYPLDSIWKMAQLAGQCTQSLPDLRPTMRFAVVQLMTLTASTQEWEIGHHTRNSSVLETGTGSSSNASGLG